jgi:uncharacterized protein YdaU (DUF1376 family)
MYSSLLPEQGQPEQFSVTPSLKFNRLPWFKTFARDKLIATAQLSLRGKGALNDLLEWEWATGGFPIFDDEAVSRVLRVSLDEWHDIKREIWPVLVPMLFQLVDQRNEIQESTEKRSAAGRKGVIAKRQKQGSSNAEAKVNHCSGDVDVDVDVEKEKTNYSCAETSSAPPSVATLPLIGKGKFFGITQSQVQAWSALYPAVDVMQQLRNMSGWLEANPTRRKTAKGILRFVVNWLAKEQNRAPAGAAAKLSRVHTIDIDQARRMLWEEGYTRDFTIDFRRIRAHAGDTAEKVWLGYANDAAVIVFSEWGMLTAVPNLQKASDELGYKVSFTVRAWK